MPRPKLSKRLAPLDYAPFEVIQHFGQGRRDRGRRRGVWPIRAASAPTHSLEVASTEGQDHLLAISGRAHLPEKPSPT